MRFSASADRFNVYGNRVWGNAGVQVDGLSRLTNSRVEWIEETGALDVRAPTYTITSPNGAAFRVDDTGKLLLGSVADRSTSALGTPWLQIRRTDGGARSLIGRWGASAVGPGFDFYKSRGASPAAFGAVLHGDTLGSLHWLGDDGDSFVESANITVIAEGTMADGRVPVSMRFATMAEGASSRVERLRLRADGVISIRANGQILATAAGHLQFRTYTRAQLATAAAEAGYAEVSNPEAGKTMLVKFNGTAWVYLDGSAVTMA
jgi:hypothetical protein